MNENILKQAGLSDNEIKIYILLLEEGALTGAQIIEKSDIKRGNTYYILDKLLEVELIEKFKIGKKTNFRLQHPDKLIRYIDTKRVALKQSEEFISENIESIVSQFNLVTNKPSISYFEGKAGLQAALKHTLKAKDTIYSVVNSEVVREYAKDINKDYRLTREKMGIPVKILMVKTGKTDEYKKEFNPQLTQIKFLDPNKFPFEMSMHIYDNFVAFFTLKDDNFVAFIVQQAEIASLQKSLFKTAWDATRF